MVLCSSGSKIIEGDLVTIDIFLDGLMDTILRQKGEDEVYNDMVM